jgi:myo-inositol 2-dehydrogenase/D-chiro-inositol 1-dehydrogenase
LKARVGIGLIGCGTIASAVHVRVLNRLRRARLVAIADPSASARDTARRLAPRAEITAGHAELLARPDVDAVVLCAPTPLHADLALEVLAADKHLYLEKPIATNEADGERVVDAARRTRVLTAVGFNRRFHPLFQQARVAIGDGAVGTVHAVSTAFCEPVGAQAMPDWKTTRASGGGVLLDLASHHVDLLRWLLADELESVEASVRSEVTEQDAANLRATMRGGATVTGFFSFRAARADFLELIGDRGVLRLDRYDASLAVWAARPRLAAVRRQRVRPSRALLEWRLRRLVRPASEPSYGRLLAGFVDTLRGNAQDLPTLEDGLRSLEAILAAERSAEFATPTAVVAIA